MFKLQPRSVSSDWLPPRLREAPAQPRADRPASPPPPAPAPASAPAEQAAPSPFAGMFEHQLASSFAIQDLLSTCGEAALKMSSTFRKTEDAPSGSVAKIG